MTPKRKRGNLRAGIDYAVCTSSTRRTRMGLSTTASCVTRKRRRLSRSSSTSIQRQAADSVAFSEDCSPPLTPPPSVVSSYRTIIDLPQELLHDILSYFTKSSLSYDNASTLLSIAT